tara:strand:+ start:47 stop:190 length:144 start_codon:yes stop_codon:yes gene_type:complete
MAYKKARRLTRYQRVRTVTKPVRVRFRTRTGGLVSFKAKKVVRRGRK